MLTSFTVDIWKLFACLCLRISAIF